MEAKKKKIIAHFLIIAFFIVAITGLVLTQTQIAYAEDKASSALPIEGDLKFSLYTNLDGIQEYKVSAYNRNLLEAIIPEEFNGIPVSEVADNAFANCKSMQYALIPQSIKRVGNNAFSNCTNLITIDGMTNVTTFGNFVFNNCSSLTDLILPSKLEKLGSNVISNMPNTIFSRKTADEMNMLNAEWADEISYKNVIFDKTIVCKETELNGKKGFIVKKFQNMILKEDVILYSYADYKGQTLPILEIDSNAFANCELNSLIIKHAKPEDEHLINIRSNAFNNFTANFVSIEVGITVFDDQVKSESGVGKDEIGYSTDIFSSSFIPDITLPTNIEFDRFGRSMFEGSKITSLKYTDKTISKNYISPNIKNINQNVFKDVSTLQYITIPNTVLYMGETVFDFFGLDSVYESYSINLEFSVVPNNWSTNWLGSIDDERVFVKYLNNIVQYDVILDMDGGTGGSNVVHAEYGKPMPGGIAPNKSNFIFQGYFTGRNGTGVKYYNADMTSAQNWNTQSNGTLYAFWKGIESVINFNKQGGINGTNKLVAEFGKPLPTAVAPNKENYVFQGYYGEPNGNGDQYYDSNMNSLKNWNKIDDTTLYAYWKGIVSKIMFDQQGGKNGTTICDAEYGAAMPDGMIAPVRENYIFQGYFESPNGQGKKYYDLNMNSVNSWNKSVDTPIFAYWKGVSCTIEFDKGEGTGGTNSITVEYGEKLPESPNVTAPNRGAGISFNGYILKTASEEKNIYDKNMRTNGMRWFIAEPTKLKAVWVNNSYSLQLYPEGGSGGTQAVVATFTEPMPTAIAPTRLGYHFMGFYLNPNGEGKKYYNADMSSAYNWDIANNPPLYAHWIKKNYSVTFNNMGGSGDSGFSITYGDNLPIKNAPFKVGYNFRGYFALPNGEGNLYYSSTMTAQRNWDIDGDTILYAHWQIKTEKFSVQYFDGTYENHTTVSSSNLNQTVNYGSSISYTAPDVDGYTFKHWLVHAGSPKSDPYEIVYTTSKTIEISYSYIQDVTLGKYRNISFCAIYTSNNCVAEGTLITLADGSQVAVENLRGDEQLLVWNLKTGSFDSAPLLFIDKDVRMNYEVINLKFSDGTTVKAISEHAFWDFDLNKYVFLRKDAAQYIGHLFNKQITDSDGNMTWTKVRLTEVEIQEEVTSAWSPVTYGHLCYYVNGMLSMPGATEGLINIFNVNNDTMAYDEESYNADIEKYGLFSYEEFIEICPVPREIFDAFNGECLKVSIGKGLITWEQLEKLIQRYVKFFE